MKKAAVQKLCLICIPYGQKFWWGIHFIGLAVFRAIRQYFISQNTSPTPAPSCVLICIVDYFLTLILKSCLGVGLFTKLFTVFRLSRIFRSCTFFCLLWVICEKAPSSSPSSFSFFYPSFCIMSLSTAGGFLCHWHDAHCRHRRQLKRVGQGRGW